MLQKGVIELLVKDDPLLKKLPFKDIKGNGLTYNVETTLSGAKFYHVGDVWVESTSVVTQATAHTAILGGDADVDNFLQATRGDLQNLMQEQIVAKTKAIKKTFLEANELVDLFKDKYDIKNYGIDFEIALAQGCTVIIEPNGGTGNQVVRSLVFLDAIRNYGGPILNADRVIIESMRNSDDFSDHFLLAAALGNLKK